MYRRFNDREGRIWEAWEVRPSAVERRMNRDRRTQRRATADRRRLREFRLEVPHELQDGWLALQGRAEKLRLAPIPEGWMHLSDAQLAELVRRAS